MNKNEPHQITIDILPDGKIGSTVIGVSGPACGPLSEWLDQLGAVLEDSPTSDYRKPAQQTTRLNTGA